MHSQHLPMTREEFELLPCPLGWKCEYRDGAAHLTPRDQLAYAAIQVKARPISASAQWKILDRLDEPRLLRCFVAAFAETIEFCDWPGARIQESAQKTLRDFFSEKRGKPLIASRVALEASSEVREAGVIGAALVVDHTDQSAMLDLLFVQPGAQRRGLATALVSAAMNELHVLGKKILYSKYHLGNHPSRSWHQEFGFGDEPDLNVARLHFAAAQHELCRQEKLGWENEPEYLRLLKDRDYWDQQVKALEVSAWQAGPESAFAFWRHRT